MCIAICVCVPVLVTARRSCQVPWVWISGQLCFVGTWHRCWEPKVGSLGERKVLLIAKPSLQSPSQELKIHVLTEAWREPGQARSTVCRLCPSVDSGPGPLRGLPGSFNRAPSHGAAFPRLEGCKSRGVRWVDFSPKELPFSLLRYSFIFRKQPPLL